jgi:hypothetical protein
VAAPTGGGSSRTRAAAGWVLRLTLATAMALAAAHYHARTAVDWMLVPLAHTLAWVASDFRVLEFGFASDRDNQALGAVARLDHTVVIGETAIVPDGSPMVVGANVGTVLQPLLVASVLVLAWPGGFAEVLLRMVLVLPLLAGVVLLDTPFSMAAWLWFALLQTHDPGRFSALVWWNTFLNGGGRLALGLMAAAFAILAAASIAGMRGHRAGRSAKASISPD